MGYTRRLNLSCLFGKLVIFGRTMWIWSPT
uniref:Uncharacterized protein n=1 Tax=Anguilla anguilla TaxID=7936 RepID=A0A0E9W603_ANGAN